MGGTSIIFTSAAFGVLLSVSRTVEEQNNQTETNIANNEGN
jgi:cell division protein FtsW (lipid II flippase)